MKNRHYGPFVIEKSIGQGGMAQVYLARRQDDLKLRVALKILKASGGDPDQFRKECRLLSELNHPRIAHLIDAGVSDDNEPWMAMEFVEGVTLDVFLKRNKPGLRQRLALFLMLCDALSHAHAHMIIHRDIKPGNIMITPEGEPKLLDFGIAATIDPTTGQQQTLTLIQERLMTPEYASPEQINGLRLTATSDVYSLGLILYELLCDERPYTFSSRQLTEILHTILEAPITRPSEAAELNHPNRKLLLGDLDTIAMKALERDSLRRYGSVEALAADIHSYLAGEPISARPATRWYLMRKFIKRNPWPVTSSLIIFLLMFAFIFQGRIQQREIAMERDVALKERQTAQQVTQYLTALFDGVDPNQTKVRDVSAFEVLENGRTMIENSLTNEPEVKDRLLSTMGRVYRILGHYDIAEQMLLSTTVPREFDTTLELVRVFHQRGDYDRALSYLDLLKEQGMDEAQRARVDHLSGRIQFARGFYREAEKAYEAAEKALSQPSMELMRDKADLFGELGKIEESIALLERVLDLQKSQLGDRHASLAYTLNSLGQLESKAGHLARAGELYESGRNMLISLYGEHHPSLIEGDLARIDLLIRQDMMEKAGQELARVQELIVTSLGRRHPLFVDCLIRKYGLAKEESHYQEAERALREALVIADEIIGNNLPKQASLLMSLGQVLEKQGQIDEAKSVLEQGMSKAIQAYGEHHPKVASIHGSLGSVLEAQSDFATAEDHFRQALKINRGVYGNDHPNIATSLNNLGYVLMAWEKHHEAIDHFKQALDITETVYGKHHTIYATYANNLASSYRQIGDWISAYPLALQVLETDLAILDETHHYVGMDYSNLGLLLMEMGQYEDAEVMIHKGLHIYEQILKPDNPEYLSNLVNLGKVLYQQKRYDQAEVFLSEALTEFESKQPRHLYRAICLRVIAELYERMNRPDKAEAMAKAALDLVLDFPAVSAERKARIMMVLARQWITKRPQKALSLLEDAEILACDNQDPLFITYIYEARALYHKKHGQTEQARNYAEQACQVRLRHMGEAHPVYLETKAFYEAL